jgi:hypothetical protein
MVLSAPTGYPNRAKHHDANLGTDSTGGTMKPILITVRFTTLIFPESTIAIYDFMNKQLLHQVAFSRDPVIRELDTNFKKWQHAINFHYYGQERN